ncbi:MAG TPA: methionyl-tRNA formyltransferase, partial [Rhodopila sp.]|nr:methionyl-tRNA formyltransferase [Rhodopila sp.]
LGARMIVSALEAQPSPVPQSEADATYAPKLSRADGHIDWTKPADQIDRQIRAFDPWPGTYTTLAGTTLKILAARPATGIGAPGTVLDAALTIACGTGAIRPVRLQLAGRAAQETAAFLRGHPIPPGTILGS